MVFEVMMHCSLFGIIMILQGQLLQSPKKKRMNDSVLFLSHHCTYWGGLVHSEFYFKGVITFSRAKIPLWEVTQGKAMSLMYQAMFVNIWKAFGCIEICYVLSRKQYIKGETPGRSHTSLPARAVFLSLLLSSSGEKPLLCKVRPSRYICAHTSSI